MVFKQQNPILLTILKTQFAVIWVRFRRKAMFNISLNIRSAGNNIRYTHIGFAGMTRIDLIPKGVLPC